MYRAKTNIWNLNYTDNYEKVSTYLENTEKKIIKIKKSYNDIKEAFTKFIEITKNYSTEITSIALELLPNSQTIEGKLIQAVQGILLFNSEALDTLVKKVQEILKNFKSNKESHSNVLEEFSRMYQINYSNVVKSYCNYISENEKYEKYLIHKELGLLNNNIKENNNNLNIIEKNKIEKKESKDALNNENESNEDNKIDNKQDKEAFNFVIIEADKEKIEREIEKDKNKNIENKKSQDKVKLAKKESIKNEKEQENQKEEILSDNHENIIKCQKNYMESVKNANMFIDKLIEFGWNGEKLLQTDFSNNCKNFVDKLLECLDLQKKKFENQSTIIKDLNEIIKSEKLSNFYIQLQQYSLHSLSIYMNKHTKNISNMDELRQKGEFDNELYKKLEIENVGNIIEEMQKNGITVKQSDLVNYEREKNISLIEKNIKLVFSRDIDTNLTDEQKNRLIEFFKNDKEYILFFLQKLNNDRSKGGKILNLKTYHLIGELFRFINNIVLEKNDFDCFKYISILSMTYFRMEKDKKVYIYEYIKDHPNFQKFEFWEKYLETLIRSDLNNSCYKNKKEILENNNKIDEKEEQFKINLATFSNVLSIVNNMTDFGLEKEFIEKFINAVKKKYTFKPEQLEQFNYLLVIYEEKKAEDIKMPNIINASNDIKDENEKKIELNREISENKKEIIEEIAIDNKELKNQNNEQTPKENTIIEGNNKEKDEEKNEEKNEIN